MIYSKDLEYNCYIVILNNDTVELSDDKLCMTHRFHSGKELKFACNISFIF